MSMSLVAGATIQSKGGTRYRIIDELGRGGQAIVYSLEGGRHIFKSFKERAELARIDWLLRHRLPSSVPVAAPIELVDHDGVFGYIAARIHGQPLVELINDPALSYVDSLRLAHRVAHALALIHEQDLVHGDVREENVLVVASRNAAGELKIESVVYIDLDNYVARGAPLPLCLGDLDVMAPELRRSRDAKLVSHSADVFALAQILHLLLLRHADAAFVKTPEEFKRALTAGSWHSDPLNPRRNDVGLIGMGFKAEMLDSKTASLFRAALSDKVGARPSAADFATHLDALLSHGRVIFCAACQWPVYLDVGAECCPHCRKAFDTPAVLLDDRRIELAQPLVLGRVNAGGNDCISTRHALLTRAGPLVVATDLGSTNGTMFRSAAAAPWLPVQVRSPLYLAPHGTATVLRLGGARGIELRLVF